MTLQTDLSIGIQDVMSKMATHSQRTNYKRLRNRCFNCGHRMVMANDIGFCTVETKDGKCDCKKHFHTAQLIKGE